MSDEEELVIPPFEAPEVPKFEVLAPFKVPVLQPKFPEILPEEHPPLEVDPFPMSIHFAKYDETGRILFLGSVPAEMLELQGENVVPGVADPTTDYVLAGVLTKRPLNPTTIDGMSLKNLPKPCVITVEGKAYDCTDDTSDLSFSQPGTYTVQVSAFPMLDTTFQVTQS